MFFFTAGSLLLVSAMAFIKVLLYKLNNEKFLLGPGAVFSKSGRRPQPIRAGSWHLKDTSRENFVFLAHFAGY